MKKRKAKTKEKDINDKIQTKEIRRKNKNTKRKYHKKEERKHPKHTQKREIGQRSKDNKSQRQQTLESKAKGAGKKTKPSDRRKAKQTSEGNEKNQKRPTERQRNRTQRDGKAKMPRGCAAAQSSQPCWEEERAAPGHAATSTRGISQPAPVEESAAANEDKASLWRKGRRSESCRGGAQGSCRARMSQPSEEKPRVRAEERGEDGGRREASCAAEEGPQRHRAREESRGSRLELHESAEERQK